MSNIIYNGHVQCLILQTAGELPTVPSPSTLIPTDAGWNDSTDIMIGEFALNAEDGIVYTRDRSGIIPIVGGGGSGVQFVDGNQPGIVDNTDPFNPIISLALAYTYTDTAISAEVTNRNNAIASSAASTLVSANAYTDSAIATLKGGVPAAGDTLNKLYNLIVGQGQFVGGHDASGGLLPTTGSGAGGAIDKGDFWRISVAGTIPGLGVLRAGDVIYASIANASVAADFFAVENNEDQATSTTLGLVKLYTTTGSNTDGTMDQNSITTALNTKQATITGAATTIVSSDLTANRILISNGSGKVAVNAALTPGSILYSDGVSVAQDNGVLFYDFGSRILYVGNNAGALPMTRVHIEATVDGFSQVNYTNKSSGTSASTDFIASADNATQTTNYIDFGINGSGNTSSDILGGALTAYLYNNGGKLVMGTQSAFDYVFFTNSVERYRTTAFGWTGFNQLQKLAQVGITQVADFVASGTTTANSTASISITGGNALKEIAVGDLISLSSAPSNFFMVTSVTSDILVGVTNLLGNGTTQTINVKKAPFSVLNNAGGHFFTISGSGMIGINQIPVTSAMIGITSSSATINTISIVGGASATAIVASGAVGISATGTNQGVLGNTSSATASTPGTAGRKNSNTNSNDGCLSANKQVTSGNGTVGIASMLYYVMSDDTVAALSFGKFGMVATNVTASGNLQQADFTWNSVASGTGTMTEWMRLTGAGNLLLGTSTNLPGSMGRFRIAQSTGIIDMGFMQASTNAIWLWSTTPSISNYNLNAGPSSLLLNSTSSAGSVFIQNFATTVATFGGRTVDFSPGNSLNGSTSTFKFTTPGSSAPVGEIIGFELDMSANISQHASNTLIALQRDAVTKARTHGFVTTGGIVTRAVTWSITGPPKTGTNGNNTTAIGLEVEAGSVVGAGGTPTTAYAAFFNAPTGATTNWALGVAGNVEFQNKISIGTGILPDGGGFKHSRVTTGSVGTLASALVTITWATAFADTNYTVTVDVVEATTSNLSLSVVHIESKTAAAITVRVYNSSAGSLTGTLNAIAVHD